MISYDFDKIDVVFRILMLDIWKLLLFVVFLIFFKRNLCLRNFIIELLNVFYVIFIEC